MVAEKLRFKQDREGRDFNRAVKSSKMGPASTPEVGFSPER
jgi:hypothetical protein